MIDQNLLRRDFPQEAMSEDNSRGFALISIKAMYIIERLNDVFGLCGTGWRYAHTQEQDNGGELGLELVLQYAVDGGGPAYYYEEGKWVGRGNGWSEPIYAFGGKKIGRNGMSPYTDTRKSAVTDALTKAASVLGVGTTVFKGQGNLDNKHVQTKQVTTRPAVIKPVGSTEFYATQKKKYGNEIPPEVKQLGQDAANGKITWKDAIERL